MLDFCSPTRTRASSNDGCVDKLRAALPDLRPRLVRIRMRPGVERATTSTLTDEGFEFPTINYGRTSGRAYRYCYGAANAPEGDRYASRVVKVDLEGRAVKSFAEDDFVFGEPLFVGRPGGTDEDDGVLVTVGSRERGDGAALVVLDARNLQPLAWADVPSNTSMVLLAWFSSRIAPPGARGG